MKWSLLMEVFFLLSYLGIGHFGRRNRAGNMENPSATISSSEKALEVHQVCLEQLQILWSLLQLFQMAIPFVIWSNRNFEWRKLDMKIKPEIKRKLKKISKLHGYLTVPWTMKPLESKSFTTHEATYPPAPVTHTLFFSPISFFPLELHKYISVWFLYIYRERDTNLLQSQHLISFI